MLSIIFKIHLDNMLDDRHPNYSQFKEALRWESHLLDICQGMTTVTKSRRIEFFAECREILNRLRNMDLNAFERSIEIRCGIDDLESRILALSRLEPGQHSDPNRCPTCCAQLIKYHIPPGPEHIYCTECLNVVWPAFETLRELGFFLD